MRRRTMRSCYLCMALVVVGLLSAAHPAAVQEQEKWISLFDGKSLDAWRTYNGKGIRGWVVEDGAMYRKSGGGDIITKDKFENFELELEWKVAPGANSGIMYRVREGDPAAYFSGPEYQILDNDKHADGKNPKTSAASLYGLIAPEGGKLNPVGEYNKAKIVIKNNHLEHWLNGTKVLEIEINSDRWNELVKNSKFNEWKQFGQTPNGHICLQDHGDPVWYRNIRIRRLEGK